MKIIVKILTCLLLSLTIIACGSSGGGGDSTVTPKLPSDATTITAANATDISRSAVSYAMFVDDLPGLREEGEAYSINDVNGLVIKRVFDQYLPSRAIALRTETEPCEDNQGTVTIDANETQSSASGSIAFKSCKVSGWFVSGGFSFKVSVNNSTGDFSLSGNGRLTITDNANSAAIALNFKVVGNDFSDSFSTTISISVSGVPGENFLLTTTQPVTGIGSDINSGEILVEGAEGTRLKITVTSTNFVDIFLDDGSGIFVFHNAISI